MMKKHISYCNMRNNHCSNSRPIECISSESMVSFGPRHEKTLNFFLNPKFQDSSHIQYLRSSVCVGPGQEPRGQVFSRRGSYVLGS